MTKRNLNTLLLNIIDDLMNVDGVKAATKTDYNLQVIVDSYEFDDLTDWLEDYFKENYPKIDIKDIFDFDSYHSSNIGDFCWVELQTIDIKIDEITD